ncbi:AraC family transcriptional regulator [Enterovibrio baiacu]|uniref:AraC family transcriptional regulator n=1 Tax=Enterovibrio baiacu TaxID=2491023 RepID=UPI001F0B8698|nr:AraC family transcriptional regulator [Enterovibrio baiacu]
MLLIAARVSFADPIFYAFPFQQPNDTTSVESIKSVGDSGMWLLDTAGKVSYYDGVHFHLLEAFVPALSKPVSCIEVFDGGLWLVADGELYEYNQNENTLTKHDIDGPAQIIATKQRLWVSTDNAVVAFQAGQRLPETMLSQPVSRIFTTQTRTYFLKDHELYFADNMSTSLFSHTSMTAVQNVDDAIWVGTREGVFVLHHNELTAAKGKASQPWHLAGKLLSDLAISSINVNEEGVWVGGRDGLRLSQQLDYSSAQFKKIENNPDDIYGFAGQNVYDIEIADNGDLWVATDQALNYRSIIAINIARFPLHDIREAMGEDRVSGLERDNDSYLMSVRNTLIALSSSTLEKQRVATLNIVVESMDRLDSTLWVAASSGLYAYSSATFEEERWRVPSMFTRQPIDSVIADSHSLWVTVGNSVYRYWPKTETIVNYGNEWASDENTRLHALVDLDDEGIWLGTTNGIFHFYDGAFNKVVSREQIGAVQSLEADGNGYLWVLSNRGVYRRLHKPSAVGIEPVMFNSAEERTRCLSLTDDAALLVTSKGLRKLPTLTGTAAVSYNANQFNQTSTLPHHCYFSDDTLALAGDWGVFSFDLQTMGDLFEREVFEASIGALFVDGKPWRLGSKHSEPLAFSSKSALMVDVGLMPFGNRKELQYRLDGRGAGNWYSTQDQRLVFDSLEPGRYALIIKSPTRTDPEREVTLLSFSINSPWFYNPWYYISFMLLMGGVGYLFARKRTMIIKAQNRQLRETVHKKVATIAKQQHFVEVTPPRREEYCHLPLPQMLPSLEEAALLDEQEGGTEHHEDQLDESREWRASVSEHIGSHFHDPEYSPSILSKALFISERSLQRRFKVEFGCTFKEALIATRLEQASCMLLQGDKISDVAVACGFNEPSYFAKSFKAKYNCTPSQFKEDKNKEGIEKKKSVV